MPDLAPSSPHSIIDVEQAFRNAIKQYTLLEQAAVSLTIDLATLSPQQILFRSTQLAKMQQELAQQDEQLVAILSLAGQEIVNANFIKTYQAIIIKVILLCDQISEQTSLIKKKITERSDNTQKS
jgi:deoxyribodipyrimidine photolyase